MVAGSPGMTVSDDAAPVASTNWRAAGRSIGGSAVMTAVWSLAAVLLIAGFAATKLFIPLHRDTATFLWMASQLDRGAVLYVDVWDLKQPGIFLFNLAAGRLFGFTAEGVHAMELLWQLAFAMTIIIALRSRLRHSWLAAVGPAAFLAGYYVFCESHQQTQLEILVGLPLFIAAWASAATGPAGAGRAWPLFAAGIAAGVATAFKHVLAPIPVAFVLAASISVWKAGEYRLAGVLLRLWLPFAAGVSLVWLLIGGAFWWLGAFDAFFQTTFLYPLQALEAVDAAPPSRLVLGILVLLFALAPWLAYALAGTRRLAQARSPQLFRHMVLWLILGFGVILMQKSSWWAYHMLLLYPPVGVLAAHGVDRVVTAFRGDLAAGQRRAMMLSALLVVPVFAAYLYPAGQTARLLVNALSGGPAELEAYRRKVSSDYAEAADAAHVLQAQAPRGPIYVFGDPTILLLSGRTQAIPVQGSAWEFYLPSLWRELPDDLALTRPVWIFVEEHSRATVEQHSPETVALLNRDYRVVWDTPYGRWYARADLPAD